MVDIRCLWDSHYSIPFIGYLPSSLHWFSIAAEANHCKLSHLKTNKTIILDSLGQKSNMSLTSVRRAAFFPGALDKNFFLAFSCFWRPPSSSCRELLAYQHLQWGVTFFSFCLLSLTTAEKGPPVLRTPVIRLCPAQIIQYNLPIILILI